MSTVTPTMADKQANLPTPSELPEADVVIFDGHCSFCTNQVTRLHRYDGKQRLAFISLHDQWVAEQFPDLSHEQMMRQMYVVDQQGDRHGGMQAIRYMSRKLPRMWVFAPLLHIPFSLPLWNWGYQQVAKRRYRWNKQNDCENGACAVHFGEKSADE